MKAIEDKTLSEPSLAGLSLKQAYPQRPAYGTGGSPVTLWANYVELNINPKLVLHSYEIIVRPERTQGKKLSHVISLLLEHAAFANIRSNVVTDFKSILLSREPLPMTENAYEFPYRAEGEDDPKEGATVYTVQLRLTHSLSVGDLVGYLTAKSQAYPDKEVIIQALNIFLHHYSKTKSNIVTIGARRAFPVQASADNMIDIGNGLAAIRGFFSSVRAATARVLVNVNVSYAAFYQPGPLLDLMTAWRGRNTQPNLRRLEAFLKNVKVTRTHLKRRKNKAGNEVIKKSTIVGLASMSDGRHLAHPPRVSKHGANADEVQFWLDELPPKQSTPGKGAKAGTPGKGGKGAKGDKGDKGDKPGGRYITVARFFLESKQPYSSTHI